MRSLLHEMRVMISIPMKMSAIFIASNPMFLETKHIEMDYHFIRDLVIKKHTVTSYVWCEDHLGDILTKPLARSSFSVLCMNLSMFNLYAPA